MDLAALLMSDPKIILLDETRRRCEPDPARGDRGPYPRVNAKGMTVLMVEHYMELIMRLSHRDGRHGQGHRHC